MLNKPVLIFKNMKFTKKSILKKIYSKNFSIFLLCFSLSIFSLSAQSIKTQDNVDIGERKILVAGCVKAANNNKIKVDGLEIDSEAYCSCVFDKLIPTIKFKELEIAVNNNKITELFINDNNYPIIKECIKSVSKISDDYKVSASKDNYIKEKQ